VSESIRFSLLQFLFWSAIICFEAFMVPYLRVLGYSPVEIGPIMSAVFGMAILGQPMLGTISDRVRSPRYLVAGALVVGGVAVSMLPLVGSAYGAILAITLVYSLSVNSLPSVLESWLMERQTQNPKVVYGISRGFGSAGFAVGGVVLGVLSERYGPAIVFPIFLGIVLVVAIVAVSMPQRERSEITDTAGRSPKDGFRAVFRNREYLFLLASALLAFTGLRAGLTFLPLLVESLDGSLSIVGSAHSIGAVSEIPFLFLAGWFLRRYSGRPMIVFALAAMGIRLLVYPFLRAPVEILLLQISHGLTFGVFLAASVDYIHRIAPPEHRGLFQTLAPAIYFGFGSILGSTGGGILIESFSLRTMYIVAGALPLAGALVFFRARTGQH